MDETRSVETRDRIVESAFTLFGRLGYDATSVDAIARDAGVGRSTFFRYFGSKDSVLFPDHERLMGVVDTRLRTSGSGDSARAVGDALRFILSHFVAEGDRARYRYRLTRTVPAVRERELLNSARYQRLFAHHFARWGNSSLASDMHAEMEAAAVVAAHNSVLRGWLRGEDVEPHLRLDDSLATAARIFGVATSTAPIVVVLREPADVEAVTAAIQHLL